MSLDGDEKLSEAHSTQLDLPIHSGLLPSSRTGPPLVLLLVIIQTEPSSMTSGELETKHIAFVAALQADAVNVHRLEFKMVAGEEYMLKAKLEKPVDDADQLHDVNVHWLKLEMVAGERYMLKA